jgi:hypothetical protein
MLSRLGRVARGVNTARLMSTTASVETTPQFTREFRLQAAMKKVNELLTSEREKLASQCETSFSLAMPASSLQETLAVAK